MKILSLARDLRRRRARERSGLFIVEGVRTVEEVLASTVPVRGALASPALDATPRGAVLRARLAERGIAVLDVDEATFASAADTDSPQGILAVAERPALSVDALPIPEDGPTRLLVLDGVQDPGNAGTMLRTATAFAATAAIALPGTVDLWSAKVVRGAMGAHFRLPVVHAAWEEAEPVLAGHGVALWGADMHGDPLDDLASSIPGRLALAIGNEGAGLSERLRTRAARLVSIPIAAGVESLNAGVAAGILLYALRPSGVTRRSVSRPG